MRFEHLRNSKQHQKFRMKSKNGIWTMTKMDHLIHNTYVPCAKDLVSLAMNENEIEDFKQVQDTKTNYLKQCDG